MCPLFPQIVLLIAFMCITLLVASLVCLTLPGEMWYFSYTQTHHLKSTVLFTGKHRVAVVNFVSSLFCFVCLFFLQYSLAAGWCLSGQEIPKSTSCTQQHVVCMSAGFLSAGSLFCWRGCHRDALLLYTKSRSGHSWWASVSWLGCWQTSKLGSRGLC